MRSNDLTTPIRNIRAITSFGTAELEKIDGSFPRAIYVGTAGNVTVKAIDDDTAVQMANLAAGIWHPVTAKAITASAVATVLVGY